MYLKVQQFTCHLCPLVFKIKNSLRLHLQFVHEVEPVSHSCTYPDCSFKAILKNKLLQHLVRVHHETPFKCETCDKGFKFHYKLLIHLKEAHVEKKRHKCLVSNCNIDFAHPFELRKHLKSSAHAVADVRATAAFKFKCRFRLCGWKCISTKDSYNTRYQMHVQLYHSRIQVHLSRKLTESKKIQSTLCQQEPNEPTTSVKLKSPSSLASVSTQNESCEKQFTELDTISIENSDHISVAVARKRTKQRPRRVPRRFSTEFTYTTRRVEKSLSLKDSKNDEISSKNIECVTLEDSESDCETTALYETWRSDAINSIMTRNRFNKTLDDHAAYQIVARRIDADGNVQYQVVWLDPAAPENEEQEDFERLFS